MLAMLRRHMMGQNQARFSNTIDEITTHTRSSTENSQLQFN
jgi:hypothetical protein